MHKKVEQFVKEYGNTIVHVSPESLYALVVNAGASYHTMPLSSTPLNHVLCN